ncbi:MAG: trigger factor [Gammaproteobacteria bacterium]|jgi:trigger factor|nr:trigger factor [Gammaproteobacteria bacterium]
MQVTVETTAGLERKMRVVVPSERVEVQVTEKIKQTAKQAKINGFRPGKVPLREVKRRFGAGIRQEVSSEMIQSTYGEALQKEDINPAGMPKIEEVNIEEGKDLEYTAVFEVFPEIEVSGLESIEVERLSSSIEEADLEKMIDTLREQRLVYAETDRAAAEKDQVNLDFEGFLEDEPFEGGKAEGTDLVLGSGSMIPGFEDGLTGLKADEEKDLKLTFPENYQAENLAGQEVLFKIKVNKVSEPELPELNDAFFEQFDVKEGGVEAFRKEVTNNMKRELDSAIKTKVKDQVMDGLSENNEVDLPQSLIDQEVNRMRQEAVQQFGGGAQFDPSMLPAEMFTEQAQKRVKIGLIVSSIVDKNNLVADAEAVRETIEEMAATYQEPEEVINYYYSNEQQLSQIQNMVLEAQIVDFVLDSAKVTDKTVSYDEAVKREAELPAEESDESPDAED